MNEKKKLRKDENAVKAANAKQQQVKKESEDVVEELNLDDLNQVSGGTMRGQVIFTPRTGLDDSQGNKQP